MLDKYLKINKEFSIFCKQRLIKNRIIRDYVGSRLQPKIAKAFNLGFCDSEILEFFKQYKEKDLEDLGLIAMNEDGEYYPVFLNRIVIPIFTAYGIVGFSGRCFYSSQQKYINTRKTLLYNKSELLYPLAFSKKFIFEKDECIIIEGYFDALALISAGMRNVVALCGTSLSNNQINQIRRWTNNVKILLDGDAAGRAASKKIHETLLEKSLFSSIITLPESYDPDVFVKERGLEELKTLIEEN